jgi:putative N-acetylmannosamine-6-phosphate epimerase
MLKLIAVAAFALLVTSSAQAITPAPLAQPESVVTEVAAACGAGRTRINGVCVARTTVRQTRRAVRRGM